MNFFSVVLLLALNRFQDHTEQIVTNKINAVSTMFSLLLQDPKSTMITERIDHNSQNNKFVKGYNIINYRVFKRYCHLHFK